VIGVPHPDFGETIVAVVVANGVTEAQVNAWVAERLARFKHPRQIAFVESLPRNAMGKVQKAELRNRYAGTIQGANRR
jgi:malonyl-CoA/methylmalonyl-CoA synthetase